METHVTIEQDRFREVLAHYPTGVCVVTAAQKLHRPVGMVVGSFTSVSLDPPLVAFFPARSSSTWRHIEASGTFCVNVLGSDQHELSRQFSAPSDDKFAGAAHRMSGSGSPILDGAIAWIDCSLDAVHRAGDHDIAVGKVLQLEVVRKDKPLLFFQGGYGEFAQFM